MKIKLLIISLLTFIAGIGVAGNSHALFTDDYQFGDLVNLGPNINTKYYEGDMTLTPDGNTMFFISDRPGGYGGYDLYTAERVNGVWQPAENMGPAINTSDKEYDPSLTPDGNTLFFTLGTTRNSKIWMTEKINGQWGARVRLPSTVNFSWANNNAQFVSHDGKWLYISCWNGNYHMWSLFRVNLATGDFSIRKALPLPFNTPRRDFAVYQTMDSKYFVVYTDSSLYFRTRAWEMKDGVYQNAGSLPAPFNHNKFTMTEDESLLYNYSYKAEGYGSKDIYVAPRITDCSSFGIASVTGVEQIINPLPLAGQMVTMDVAVTGNSAPQDISWALFANGSMVAEGSSLQDGVTWDGRNSTGKIEPGTYNLVLSLETNKGECIAEQSLTAVIELTDGCKLRVTFPEES